MQAEFGLVGLIALLQVAGLVTLILIVLAVMLVRRRRRDVRAAGEWVEQIKRGREARGSRLRELLGQAGLDGEAVETAVQALLRAEQNVYQQFVDTYLSRDPSRLRCLDQPVQQLLDLGLESQQGAASAEDGAASREILNRLFFEYCKLSGVELEPGSDLSAAQIKERLDSGELGGEAKELDFTQADEGGAEQAQEASEDGVSEPAADAEAESDQEAVDEATTEPGEEGSEDTDAETPVEELPESEQGKP